MADSSGAPSANAERWQARLLPLMSAVLVAAGVCFLIVSLWQYVELREGAAHGRLELAPMFDAFERAHPGEANTATLHFRVLATLEQDLIARRYHQVNSAMLARVWTRYMGFLTGMLLALVGAVFVLGKIKEDATQLSARGGGFALALGTTSPGLVLTVLGAALMAVTLAIPFDLKTRDVGVYLGGANVAGAETVETPAPWPADGGELDAPPPADSPVSEGALHEDAAAPADS